MRAGGLRCPSPQLPPWTPLPVPQHPAEDLPSHPVTFPTASLSDAENSLSSSTVLLESSGDVRVFKKKLEPPSTSLVHGMWGWQ